jgi:hypothetical protein
MTATTEIDPRVKALAETKIAEHTAKRDELAATVTRALSLVQPDVGGLERFYDAAYHALAVEAWTHVLKEWSRHSAMMTMHHWATGLRLTPHPVHAMLLADKVDIAHEVVETLAKSDLLTVEDLRVYALGIWGMD